MCVCVCYRDTTGATALTTQDHIKFFLFFLPHRFNDRPLSQVVSSCGDGNYRSSHTACRCGGESFGGFEIIGEIIYIFLIGYCSYHLDIFVGGMLGR